MQRASLLFSSIALIFLVLTFSCAKKESKDSPTSFFDNEALEQSDEGSYIARLMPMNASLAGFSTGNAIIDIKGDHVTIKVNMKNTPGGIIHAQQIFAVPSCPDENQDLNKDGYIDPVEASKSLGKILISLDGDLNSQENEVDSFPVSDHLGSYKYLQHASLSKLLSDLYHPINESLFVKFQTEDLLNLEEKIIVVMGVAEETYLPGSIQSLKPQTDRKSLIIACGEISRNNSRRSDELSSEISY